MAGLTYDGIPSTQIDSSNFSGANIYGSVGSIINLVTGSVIDGDGRLRSVGAGSPTSYGLSIQTGSAIATNVSVTVAFGTPFTVAPRVILTTAQSGTLANASYVGSSTTTGFVFFGESGLAHNYIAIGA